jgi:hypothetical protein
LLKGPIYRLCFLAFPGKKLAVASLLRNFFPKGEEKLLRWRGCLTGEAAPRLALAEIAHSFVLEQMAGEILCAG